jgi:hypothetical protein
MAEIQTSIPQGTKGVQTDRPAVEQFYTPADTARRWRISVDLVRRIFEFEPGVLIFIGSRSRAKRRYRTLRIPQSVLERVEAQSIVGNGKPLLARRPR